ncbi:hypothetical protein OF83DRAFT_1172418 [Amylostereum chailletii]|nr:hypothetical protein OF83DRAFT_1172418 [Amylostereum chailletii]
MEAFASIIKTTQALFNTLTFIGCLPDEILAHIFHHLSAMEVPRSSYKPKPPPGQAIGWILVTHVCRRWREVALHNPALWSSVNFDLGSTWAQEMARRSKHSPLNVESLFGLQLSGVPPGALEIVREHTWHLRHVQFYASYKQMQPIITALSVEAPQLRTLALTVDSSTAEPSDADVPLPQFLGGSAPHLRTLHLSIPTLPLLSAGFLPSCLTTLHLQGGPMPYDVYIIMLGAMYCMVDLQDLQLLGCLPDQAPEETLQEASIATLPQLTALRLSGKATQSQCFLDRVVLPSITSIDFDIDDIPQLPDALPSVSLPVINTNLDSWEEPLWTLDSLAITPGVVCFSFEAPSRMVANNEIVIPNKGVSLRLSPDLPISDYVHRIASLYPLQDLSSIEITSHARMNPEDWTTTFAPAINVTRVEVAKYAAEAFVRALTIDMPPPAHSTGPSDARPTPTYIFPDLDDLVLSHVNFGKRVSGGTREFPLYQFLGRAIACRYVLDLVPKSLYVSGCVLRREWVDWWTCCAPEASKWWEVDDWDNYI